MNDGDLDLLLSQPLDAVADDGFSARVAAKVERTGWWRERAMLFAPVAAAAAIVPFLPGDELTAVALKLTPLFAESGAVAFAFAMLALTLTFERRMREA